MGQTPDDITGGVTDAGKIILVDEERTLDAPGELRWNSATGRYELRDGEGTFDPREGEDEKVKVSANDTAAGYLEGKIVAGVGIEIEVVDEGANEKLEIHAGGGNPYWRKQARLQCPTERNGLSNAWVEVGTVLWDYAEYGSTNTRRWRGLVAGADSPPAPQVSVRAVLESDGTVLGVAAYTDSNTLVRTIPLTNLPEADDAVSLQVKRDSGKAGEIIAGQFEFIEEETP